MKNKVLIFDQDDYAAGLYARKFEGARWQAKTVSRWPLALAEMKNEFNAFLADLKTLKEQKVRPKDFSSQTRTTASLLVLLIDITKEPYPEKTVSDYGADTYLLKGHFVPAESVAKVARLVDEGEEE